MQHERALAEDVVRQKQVAVENATGEAVEMRRKLADMVEKQGDALGEFISKDPKGKHVGPSNSKNYGK